MEIVDFAAADCHFKNRQNNLGLFPAARLFGAINPNRQLA